MNETTRLVLIGFSGSGKSTVARLLADRLGWSLIDTDADIGRSQHMTVPEIFATRGEPFFRDLERRALLAGLDADRVVIATGGGAVVDPSLWNDTLLSRPGTLVVALDVQPQTVLDRLRRQQNTEGAAVERPMLAGDDPLARIRDLKASRQSVYDRAGLTLVVDRHSPSEVVDEIVSIMSVGETEITPALRLSAASASSDIYIRSNVREHIGHIVTSRWPRAQRAWIISDETVVSLHGDGLIASLRDAGFEPHLLTVPAGEASKSWNTAADLLDALLDSGIERGDVIVALGGGVIGDLAGFVAATVLRGVPLVQVPTSLLAMVDSSIGGKTGINHRTGKNLIGAFYQPPVVVIDPMYLRTLPARELNAGWAEIVKHAVIQPSTPGGDRRDLLTFLERNRAHLRALSEPALTYVIRRNVALKAAVVEADERESGVRALLNFGHTLGHAIEAADYKLLHGEAVAVGIRAVMRLAVELGSIEGEPVARVDALLDAFQLPRVASADEATVIARMKSDKKRVSGTQRWVVPVSPGGVVIRDDVAPEAITRALRSVTLASADIGQL